MNFLRKLFLPLAVLFLLPACAGNADIDPVVDTDTAPADYREATEMAKVEFDSIFAGSAGVQIVETSTAARTGDCDHVVIQVRYSSQNGNGTYGFEFQRDENGTYEILRQGEDVTPYDLAG